jgi:hypothetical protein
MNCKIVLGPLNFMTAGKPLQMFQQQGMIEGSGLVIIQAAALLRRESGMIPVIAVLGQQNRIWSKPLADGFGHPALSAARPAGNADLEWARGLNLRAHGFDYA